MTDVVVALADLRSSLAWPDDDVDVTARALSRIGPRSRRPRWPIIAAIAVAGVGAGVPVAAHYLSIGGVRIEQSGRDLPADIGGDLLLGRPTEVRSAAPRPPALGAPARAFEGRPAGGYTDVWSGPVILTSFPGRVERDLIGKVTFNGATVVATTVDGEPAYWIGTPHTFLYYDERGDAQQDTLRLSGNALVWTRDGVTYRLESDRTLAESVELAESMF